MRLSEIHAEIEAGRDPGISKDQAFATLVAIEHLAQIEGLPVSALDFAAPQFGAKYIYQFPDLRGSWGGRAQYLSWRNLILNAQMRFTPGDVDADPWASLGRAGRLWKKKEQADFHDLYLNIPPGTHPREVTDALLGKVHDEIPPEMEPRLRAGLNGFRRLFRNDLALRTGLLPDLCPKPLPGIRNHRLHTSMSPEIENWRNRLSDQEVVFALNYLNRLAIAGGRLNGEADTLNDLRVALCDLPNPAEVGVPSIRASTFRGYVNLVRRALGGPDPRKSPAEQAWADLRTAARAAGCKTSFLWAVGNPAAAKNLFPEEITENVALELIASYKNGTMWSLFRRGCEQFDALRGKVPPNLLPPSRLGITRPPPRPSPPPKPILPPDLVKTAWTDLYAQLRERGWTHKEVGALSYLRVRACAAGIAPEDLSQDFIDILERDITAVADRTRLRAAVRSVAELSRDPEFGNLPVLTPPAYTAFTHGGAGEKARAELEDLMGFMNAATGTRRGFRVAVGVLTDAMGRPDSPLKETLQTNISAYDLGPHEPRRKVHTDKIRNLREFIELPWTQAWRELQRVVTETGITALDNPVPKVLAWNPGTDPDGLTREWAQRLDREYRSTHIHPPYGLTYLAKKLARHLAAFDALHDIPAVAGSGLLPPRIGPIR
jgi:hypothetical protein